MIARDSYTLLHLPMVAGIVLLAPGIKAAIGHVGDAAGHRARVELCGGAALYLVAHVPFRLRNVGSLNRQRIVAAVVLLAAHPGGDAGLGARRAGARRRRPVGLIAYEALRFREARARIRAGGGSMRFSPPPDAHDRAPAPAPLRARPTRVPSPP